MQSLLSMFSHKSFNGAPWVGENHKTPTHITTLPPRCFLTLTKFWPVFKMPLCRHQGLMESHWMMYSFQLKLCSYWFFKGIVHEKLYRLVHKLIKVQCHNTLDSSYPVLKISIPSLRMGPTQRAALAPSEGWRRD